MNKNLLIGLVVVLVALIIIFNGSRVGEKDLEISEVCFEESCFIVEVADDSVERARGLMDRDNLCSDCGMLFVYEEEGDYKFWMKNTLIPLDIIWLDSKLEVIHIANAVPCVTSECELYGPDEDSLYVLEVGSGRSAEIGLEVGDSLELVYS